MKEKNFYKLHSEICKTLANPKRQEILNTLRKKEMTVTELVKETGLPQANISQHLSLLRARDVVASRKEGTHVLYSIANSKIIKAFDLMSEVLQESLAIQNKTIKSVMRTHSVSISSQK